MREMGKQLIVIAGFKKKEEEEEGNKSHAHTHNSTTLPTSLDLKSTIYFHLFLPLFFLIESSSKRNTVLC